MNHAAVARSTEGEVPAGLRSNADSVRRVTAVRDLEYLAEPGGDGRIDRAPFDGQPNRSLAQLPIQLERIDTQYRKRGHMLGDRLDVAA